MRIPEIPPSLSELAAEMGQSGRFGQILRQIETATTDRRYLHWDKLRRLSPPHDLTHREWWMLLKLSREATRKPVALKDPAGRPFFFSMPDTVMEELHRIDLGAGGLVDVPEPIISPHMRDRYLVSSLMEEAITSSQLEGAVTTREVARELIRTGRKPRDISEQMILNTYATMQRIGELQSSTLSPEIILRIHRLVTEKTLTDPNGAGRFRSAGERVVVGDLYGQVFHDPPPAGELPKRMEAMCGFANGTTPDYFVHPVVRAIILHFWLAYDHPFIDGNGRTARALFYWAMLHGGYWLFAFISISSALRKAPAKYGRSFLYAETDDNDLTYFLVAQVEVIRRAIDELHAYIERKRTETQEVEMQIRTLDLFNHRQVALIRHALRHPEQSYTFVSHQTSHNVVYQTARTDLLDLWERGMLERIKRGRQIVFRVPVDLSARLKRHGKPRGGSQKVQHASGEGPMALR